jgi:hypothetical protein
MNLDAFHNPSRIFQYDYIFFDAIFLVIWIFILLKNKKYSALKFGLIIAPIIYVIDALYWWNTFAGAGLPKGTFLREYWIGSMQVPHPLGRYVWLKFGADFMMTISYSLFTFPWLWIMFENVRATKYKQIIKYTALFFASWILVPLLSKLLPINDLIVSTIRHTNTSLTFWIVNAIVGYVILFLIYRREPRTVLKIFLAGMTGALVMEIPLYLFKIRPTSFAFIIFETIFLLNQGVAYLFLIYDKVLPYFRKHNTIAHL